MNMRLTSIVLVIVTALIFQGCALTRAASSDVQGTAASLKDTAPCTAPDIAPDSNTMLACNGLYYFVEEATAEKCTVRLISTSCRDMIYGKMFTLEREINGEYVTVDFGKNAAFEDIGIIMPAGGSQTHTFSWKVFVGKIAAGRYRILSEFYDNGKKLDAVFEFEIK